MTDWQINRLIDVQNWLLDLTSHLSCLELCLHQTQENTGGFLAGWSLLLRPCGRKPYGLGMRLVLCDTITVQAWWNCRTSSIHLFVISIPIQLSKQNVALASYLSEREVVDVLMDFPSSRHPLQSILSLLKALQPRYYSIASSPLKVRSRQCYLQGSPATIHL